MPDPIFTNLVGEAPAFVDCLRVIRRLAGSDVTALIQGETGTGKELAARAIHYLGSRCNYPFIPVNCGALPNDLVENELFGHVRGAFTDARDTQPGVIASAEGGTLFFDEIECLTARGQVVLLRFLQDRMYRPLGGRHHVKANVRIIAASNTSIAALASAGLFRQDLMYRLAIMTVTMPPLRERLRDLPLLAAHFLKRFAAEERHEPRTVDSESLAVLARHRWPGNVRELENVLRRELLLADALEISIRDLGDATIVPDARQGDRISDIPIELGFRRAKAHVIAEFERAFLTRVLVECDGNVSRAARLSGKERRAFGRLLKKHGLRDVTAVETRR